MNLPVADIGNDELLIYNYAELAKTLVANHDRMHQLQQESFASRCHWLIQVTRLCQVLIRYTRFIDMPGLAGYFICINI
jgi:hypothetical protein